MTHMGLRSLRSLGKVDPRARHLVGTFFSFSLGSSSGLRGRVAAPHCLSKEFNLGCFAKEALLDCFGNCAIKGAVVHDCLGGGERGGSSRWRSCSISAGGSAILPSARGFGTADARFYSRIIWDDENEAPRLLVVQPRIHPLPVLKAKLLEALRLADSLEDSRNKDAHQKQKGLLPPYVLVQSPGKSSSRRLQAGAYFGAGTIDIVRVHVDKAASQGRLDAVFVNAPLSGIQQRTLEDAWGKPVLDRVGLIIKFFGAHAQTKAAKLQVELASLYYTRSRLVRARGSGGGRLGFGAGGESEVVSARGRATGAIGGAGETEIQLQRRRVGQRQHRLKLLLAEVDRTQSLHRAARRRQEQGLTSAGHESRPPIAAVVGYTNAGKSSLVAALSQSSLYVDDKLFATLDTRSRRVVLPSGQKVILSDTVGFISDLPIQLVKAFQSTLDEVVEADYLLHVIDSSAPNANEQRETVLQVLETIGVSSHKLKNCLIEVWNKVDLAEGEFGNIGAGGLEKQINSSELLAAGVSSQGDGLTGDANWDPSNVIQLVHGSEQGTGLRPELLGLEWSHEGVSCVATSARTRMGLKELCQLLDKKLPCELERQP